MIERRVPVDGYADLYEIGYLVHGKESFENDSFHLQIEDLVSHINGKENKLLHVHAYPWKFDIFFDQGQEFTIFEDTPTKKPKRRQSATRISVFEERFRRSFASHDSLAEGLKERLRTYEYIETADGYIDDIGFIEGAMASVSFPGMGKTAMKFKQGMGQTEVRLHSIHGPELTDADARSLNETVLLEAFDLSYSSSEYLGDFEAAAGLILAHATRLSLTAEENISS